MFPVRNRDGCRPKGTHIVPMVNPLTEKQEHSAMTNSKSFTQALSPGNESEFIDPFNEDVFPLSQASKRLRGRRVHPSTVWRWVQRGIRGHKLKTIKIGGVTCTSESALRFFFNSISNEKPLTIKKPFANNKQAIVEKELSKFGV